MQRDGLIYISCEIITTIGSYRYSKKGKKCKRKFPCDENSGFTLNSFLIYHTVVLAIVIIISLVLTIQSLYLLTTILQFTSPCTLPLVTTSLISFSHTSSSVLSYPFHLSCFLLYGIFPIDMQTCS